MDSTLSPSPTCERYVVSESTPPYPAPAKINKTIASNTSARGLIDENVPRAGFTTKIFVDLRSISKRYVSMDVEVCLEQVLWVFLPGMHAPPRPAPAPGENVRKQILKNPPIRPFLH